MEFDTVSRGLQEKLKTMKTPMVCQIKLTEIKISHDSTPWEFLWEGVMHEHVHEGVLQSSKDAHVRHEKKSRRANVADQESNGRKSADMFIVDRAERAAGEGREQVGS